MLLNATKFALVILVLIELSVEYLIVEKVLG